MRSVIGGFWVLNLILFFAVSFWTQRSVDFILKITGSQNEMPYWLALIASYVFNYFILGFNILVEIFRLIY
jgi:hypothetical protein